MRFALLLLLPILAACHKPVESRLVHVPHLGDSAVLWRRDTGPVYLAVQRKDAYQVQMAIARNDIGQLDSLVHSNTAFAVPAGTVVQVTGEFSESRQVLLQEGPMAGKSGWVEWEFLRSAPPPGR